MRNFFIFLMCLGVVISTGQWFMYRTAFANLTKTWTIVFFVLPPIIFSLTNGYVNALPRPIIRGLAWVSGLWFGYFYYSVILLVLFVLTWIAGKIGGFSRYVHYLPKFGFFLIILLIAVGWWRAGHRVYREETYVTDKKIEKPLTIAFVSDLHLGALYGYATTVGLVDMINAAKPDLVLIGGDIVDGNLEFVRQEQSLEPLAKLQAPLGVYAVYGNHDVMHGTAEDENVLMEEVGVHFVKNEVRELGNNIMLTGLDDFMRSANSYVFPDGAKDKLDIFMEHQPRSIQKAAAQGYDLYFAGHTHAGQFYPNRELTKRMYLLDYGSKTFNHMLATVSDGYGLWGIPIRLGPAPEVVVVKVKGK